MLVSIGENDCARSDSVDEAQGGTWSHDCEHGYKQAENTIVEKRLSQATTASIGDEILLRDARNICGLLRGTGDSACPRLSVTSYGELDRSVAVNDSDAHAVEGPEKDLLQRRDVAIPILRCGDGENRSRSASELGGDPVAGEKSSEKRSSRGIPVLEPGDAAETDLELGERPTSRVIVEHQLGQCRVTDMRRGECPVAEEEIGDRRKTQVAQFELIRELSKRESTNATPMVGEVDSGDSTDNAPGPDMLGDPGDARDVVPSIKKSATDSMTKDALQTKAVRVAVNSERKAEIKVLNRISKVLFSNDGNSANYNSAAMTRGKAIALLSPQITHEER
ncbi:hypothetical protein PHYPSEUDO_011655 [Phytophthora pseudosyringae]|uniref:Uncharacterized protein n=1 Tax=Phytophthora pseudosyringae TaxID=221518 RepID=A0A8T1VBE7_9STRA|nr:hypothetical protein PHYPSEUDO_011655 [Phytophthora pseudosyringae]